MVKHLPQQKLPFFFHTNSPLFSLFPKSVSPHRISLNSAQIHSNPPNPALIAHFSYFKSIQIILNLVINFLFIAEINLSGFSLWKLEKNVAYSLWIRLLNP
ncbi:hypothetical protein L6452_26483 [Arctium lappa]|uniref:Uncharacterized protein n=1 Tax=Arctium lappa TaxID=4217 RepID=A0ACB8ZTT1_ARCLA|nr:hypothetical protein L6452_26483 [Arctium lappa]